jgi:hypothetical protein
MEQQRRNACAEQISQHNPNPTTIPSEEMGENERAERIRALRPWQNEACSIASTGTSISDQTSLSSHQMRTSASGYLSSRLRQGSAYGLSGEPSQHRGSGKMSAPSRYKTAIPREGTTQPWKERRTLNTEYLGYHPPSRPASPQDEWNHGWFNYLPAQERENAEREMEVDEPRSPGLRSYRGRDLATTIWDKEYQIPEKSLDLLDSESLVWHV